MQFGRQPFELAEERIKNQQASVKDTWNGCVLTEAGQGTRPLVITKRSVSVAPCLVERSFLRIQDRSNP